MIMMCQCTFISCNKCITPVEYVDNGGSCICGELGDQGKALYFLFSFAVNPKLVLKIKSIKK